MAKQVKLNIGGRSFECYPLREAQYINISAIFAIIDVKSDGTWTVLDVDETGGLGAQLDMHPHKECWVRDSIAGNLWVCLYPTPKNQVTAEERKNLADSIRHELNPRCGNSTAP